MNASLSARIAAACASVCITLVLFSGVAGLAEPPVNATGNQLATAAIAVAQARSGGPR